MRKKANFEKAFFCRFFGVFFVEMRNLSTKGFSALKTAFKSFLELLRQFFLARFFFEARKIVKKSIFAKNEEKAQKKQIIKNHLC